MKFVDQLIYLGSNILSTEIDVNIPIGKTWNTINRLSVIGNSVFGDIKSNFFQVVAVLVQLDACIT